MTNEEKLEISFSSWILSLAASLRRASVSEIFTKRRAIASSVSPASTMASESPSYYTTRYIMTTGYKLTAFLQNKSKLAEKRKKFINA
ncbi:MAG: hypothetical protein ACYDEF_09920 [Methanosarcina sp.]